MIQGFPEDLPAAIWLGLDGLETVGRVLSDTISIVSRHGIPEERGFKQMDFSNIIKLSVAPACLIASLWCVAAIRLLLGRIHSDSSDDQPKIPDPAIFSVSLRDPAIFSGNLSVSPDTVLFIKFPRFPYLQLPVKDLQSSVIHNTKSPASFGGP